LTIPAEIRPLEKARVIDLVEAAGFDVSSWGDYRGGKEKAATNPKYCYEWSFVKPHETVILNLWFGAMQEIDGQIVQNLNVREWQGVPGRRPSVWANRSAKIDEAIRTAYYEELPVRVIVCDGVQRDPEDASPSRVMTRMLDPKTWAVTAYDQKTGRSTITRDVAPDKFVDQFSLPELRKPEKFSVTTNAYGRDPEVRRTARIRAQGRCEYCGELGFTMTNGGIYIETHHVVPLFQRGHDIKENVAALCPDHHRQAHHGNEQTKIAQFLANFLAKYYLKN